MRTLHFENVFAVGNLKHPFETRIAAEMNPTFLWTNTWSVIRYGNCNVLGIRYVPYMESVRPQPR